MRQDADGFALKQIEILEALRNAVYEALNHDSESSRNGALSEKVGLPEISKLLRGFHKGKNSMDLRFGNFRQPFFFDSNACLCT